MTVAGRARLRDPAGVLIRRQVYSDARRTAQQTQRRSRRPRAAATRTDDRLRATSPRSPTDDRALDLGAARGRHDVGAGRRAALDGRRRPGGTATAGAVRRPRRHRPAGAGAGRPDGADGRRPIRAGRRRRGRRSAVRPATRPAEYVVRVYADDGALQLGRERLVAAARRRQRRRCCCSAVGAARSLTRRIVRPLTADRRRPRTGSRPATSPPARPPTGPREVAEVGRRAEPARRPHRRAHRRGARDGRRPLAPAAHAADRAAPGRRGAARPGRGRARRRARQRPSSACSPPSSAPPAAPQREGRMPSCDATAVVGERVAFWSALAEDQGRAATVDAAAAAAAGAGAAPRTSPPPSTRCSRTSSPTRPRAPRSRCTRRAPTPAPGSRSPTTGPGLPDDAHVRGRSDRGSSGLGLDIARRCAEAVRRLDDARARRVRRGRRSSWSSARPLS